MRWMQRQAQEQEEVSRLLRAALVLAVVWQRVYAVYSCVLPWGLIRAHCRKGSETLN